MNNIKLAFIGGTGLYEIEGLTNINQVCIDTPFGKTSDLITLGRLQQETVAFLPRHGHDHQITPSNIPARANIYALKTLGVERLISINAVGSLQKNINPRDAVIPGQLIDRTYLRVNTFFDKSLVAYISFARPFCNELSTLLAKACEIHSTVHRNGTMLVIEGPAFSTSAESRLYQQWGGDVIGMTVLPEAKLAREAEMCYSSLSLVTDNDAWLETDEVNVNTILSHLKSNACKAKSIIADLIPRLNIPRTCECQNALRDTIMTNTNSIDPSEYIRLKSIISKYSSDNNK